MTSVYLRTRLTVLLLLLVALPLLWRCEPAPRTVLRAGPAPVVQTVPVTLSKTSEPSVLANPSITTTSIMTPTTVLSPVTTRRTVTTVPRKAPRPAAPVAQSGQGNNSAAASWYAAGLRSPDALTFAHLTLPKGTRVRFSYGGRSVVAVCNDYGPKAYTGKQFDLSRGAFRALAPLSVGTINVTWEVL